MNVPKKPKVFLTWAKSKYLSVNDPHGDFVRDMVEDHYFPWVHSFSRPMLLKYSIEVDNYLRRCGACSHAIDCFYELFGEYVKELLAEINKEQTNRWKR